MSKNVARPGNGHNFGGQRVRNMETWCRMIAEDRNWARLLFRLPLQEPVRRDIRQAYIRAWGTNPEVNTRGSSQDHLASQEAPPGPPGP